MIKGIIFLIMLLNFCNVPYTSEYEEKVESSFNMNEYYSPKEISQILGIHNNSLKRLLRNLKRYKEGYKKEDIIFTLMGCVRYTVDTLEELALDLLIDAL